MVERILAPALKSSQVGLQGALDDSEDIGALAAHIPEDNQTLFATSREAFTGPPKMDSPNGKQPLTVYERSEKWTISTRRSPSMLRKDRTALGLKTGIPELFPR
jgi:hypothetical protein